MMHASFTQSLAEAFLRQVDVTEQIRVLEELDAFQQTWYHAPLLRDVLMGSASLRSRLKILRQVTDHHLSVTTQNILSILLRQQALHLLGTLLDKVRRLRMERGLGREVAVTVVESLLPADRKELQRSLEEKMAMPVSLQEYIDPDVIGGLRLDSQEWTWDATAHHRLRRLIQTLRAS